MKLHKTAAIATVGLGLFIGSAPVMAQTGAAVAAVDATQDLDPFLSQLAKYKLGDSRAALERIQDLVIKAQQNPQQRAALARKLAGLLTTEATLEAKDFACRQLYLIATPAEVSDVAKLLPDEKLSHMARYVLEGMANPAADAAMRQALTGLKGQLLIGVVNSLGNRRDAQSVPAMKAMLAGPDVALATAAAAALGRIGTPEAAATLATQKAAATPEVKLAVADAYLQCADELLKNGKKAEAAAMYEEMRAESQPLRIRIAGVQGLVTAAPDKAVPILIELLKGGDIPLQAIAASFARQVPGDEYTKVFASVMPSLPASAQACLIDALATRADAAAKPAVLNAIRSQDAAVRKAAIRAMATLGAASEVGVLAEAAAKGSEQDAARDTLARLRGATIDQAIASALVSGNADVRIELVKALGARRAVSTIPSLIELAAKDPAEQVRVAALDALGMLASDADVPALVDRLVQAKSTAERDAAKSALSAASTRVKDRDACAAPAVAAMQNATGATKVALITALTRIGGAKALDAIRAAQKDADVAVQDAALRGMIDWPDAAAIPDVMNIARLDNPTYRSLAIRGLFQLLAKPGAPAGTEAMTLYQQMMSVAIRPDDKKVVLAKLGEVKDPGALAIVLPCLADDAVRSEAAAAIIRIARAIGPKQQAASAALQKVAADQKVDETLRKAAQEALDKGK